MNDHEEYDPILMFLSPSFLESLAFTTLFAGNMAWEFYTSLHLGSWESAG